MKALVAVPAIGLATIINPVLREQAARGQQAGVQVTINLECPDGVRVGHLSFSGFCGSCDASWHLYWQSPNASQGQGGFDTNPSALVGEWCKKVDYQGDHKQVVANAVDDINAFLELALARTA